MPRPCCRSRVVDKDANLGPPPPGPRRPSKAAVTSPDTASAGGVMPMSIIAGIGASAGGIEALQAFFQALPADSGVAFVVVVHLSPEHRSMLPAIIAARTTMAVEQATSAVPLQANRVYVIPPDRRLQITDNSI